MKDHPRYVLVALRSDTALRPAVGAVELPHTGAIPVLARLLAEPLRWMGDN